MEYTFDFAKKTVIVTGAERGIGLAIAEGFASLGADVVIAGLNEALFDDAKAKIEAHGVRCLCVKCDVSDEASVKVMVETAIGTFGRIDVLVNNAGINKLAPAEEMPLVVWQNILNVNLTGTFLVCREVGGVMLSQGGGAIVNVASMSGLIVNPLPQRQCAYNSSKAGVIMLTKCLANEWAERGIRVNAIAPGFFSTQQNAKLLWNEDGTPTARTGKILAATPMGRFGETEELEGGLLFLLDDKAAGFITGVVLPIDGGFSAYSGV